ncbi:hypothetical protein ANCDUO_03039 [Ancylostoma duodenale]|uniref:Uncharacterized protein n=1 Tax=Ancylostoma duodenale TaxID=51022 RepID=A0A0C2GYP7_9BILA|nr:hypothetical protein ANCDUO_03039 [Ancylostoma duodenale]
MPKLLKPSTMKLFRKCPDGQKPMVFPSTQQPLMCDVTRACPAGFLCTTRMCCPSAVQRRIPVFSQTSLAAYNNKKITSNDVIKILSTNPRE